MNYYDITEEELIAILKSYNKDVDDSLNDYPTIIKRAEVNEEWNDVTFTFAYGKLILDLETLAYKEGSPLNAISQKILPVEDERKRTEEYFLEQQKYLKERGWV